MPIHPTRPALRPLEIRQVRTGPRRGVLLVDPIGLTPGAVFVPADLVPVVGRFDGTRSIETIERELELESGAPPPPGYVAELATQLEESLLLDSELFRTALERTADHFARADTRPARHAGSNGYPADSHACGEALDRLLALPAREDVRSPAPRGLVAPHIDLGRGAEGYAKAFGALATRAAADLYVVLGTGHAGPSAPVAGLAADWETPRGRMATDREFVAAVHDRIGPADPVDVLLHRDEHSLEFQMLFLAHLFAGNGAVRVAGFLCGALPSGAGDPDDEPYVGELIAAFRGAEGARRVCYIAGADLAHVGPAFGDRVPIDRERLDRLAADDRARLAHLESGEPGAFHRATQAAGNPDRVCSATALYLTARLCDRPARLLHYGQAVAGDGEQCVTFCSAVFD